MVTWKVGTGFGCQQIWLSWSGSRQLSPCAHKHHEYINSSTTVKKTGHNGKVQILKYVISKIAFSKGLLYSVTKFHFRYAI